MLVLLEYTLEFVLAKQSVIDKDAVQAVANGLVEQHCSHRRIHTATQAEYHFAVANLSFE